MPKCVKIRGQRREVCIGDLDKLVTLQDRTLTAPTSGVDASEGFGNDNAVWSMIITKTGDTFFDGVSTEIDITHWIYIRFISTVTAETWIDFESKRYDILDVENLDQRSDFMKLRCNNRGDKAKLATGA